MAPPGAAPVHPRRHNDRRTWCHCAAQFNLPGQVALTRDKHYYDALTRDKHYHDALTRDKHYHDALTRDKHYHDALTRDKHYHDALTRDKHYHDVLTRDKHYHDALTLNDTNRNCSNFIVFLLSLQCSADCANANNVIVFKSTGSLTLYLIKAGHT